MSMKQVAVTLASLAEEGPTTAADRDNVRAYLDYLDAQEKQRAMADESRFPRVGGADVYAYWYDRNEDRFVILAHSSGAANPWLVAYARELADDSGWFDSGHEASYGDAAAVWFRKVNKTVNAAGVAPTV